MPYWYFDTSALVKHYVREPGSMWVSALVNDHSQIIFTSDVAIAETSAAFAILNRTGQLPRPVLRQALANFYQDTSRRYQLATLTRVLAFHAAQLAQQYPLKGYDAIHLATALAQADFLRAYGVSLQFVAGDAQLLKAAQAEGLAVENPFDHIALDS